MPGDPVALFRALSLHNSHWRTGRISPLIRKNDRPRRPFVKLLQEVDRLPFRVLAGPRQVGKTTLAGHLMEALIEKGVPPDRILYALLDQPQVELELDGRLALLVSTYERFVLGEPLSDVDTPVHFFLDEIHTLRAWDTELKGLYDAYHPNLRVFATGSSSAALLNPRRADLPGRVAQSKIYPMKFSETLPPRCDALTEKARRIRTRVPWDRPAKDVRAALATALQQTHDSAQKWADDILSAEARFLVRGGYPAAQSAEDEVDAVRFFEAALSGVISKDLKVYPNLRKPGLFSSFLARLAKDHGGAFKSAAVAQDLGLDKETPASWKAIAEDIFLVQQLPPLNESFRVVPRKLDKLYVQDPGWLAFLTATWNLQDLEDSGRVGLVVEGVVLDHLRRLQFNAFRGRTATVGFWAKPEVDFIVEMPKNHLAVEVKYRRDPRAGRQRLATTFADREDVISLSLTRDRMDVMGEVLEIPAWLLLLTA